jgi:NAD(P)H dehydrogenase (quinone)
MKIGITGATGQLGRLVVEKLKQRGKTKDLVALVRSLNKAADLGIEARAFDYTKAETLVDALTGIDHLLLISGSEIGHRKTQHQNIIDAARKASIKWVVYTSLLHADTSTLSLAVEHLETEELLNASGIPHTILRNGWYTENYTASVPNALAAGVLIGSAGDGKISSATREDYAEAAAVVLTSNGHQGKVYELAGDVAYTLKDLAAEVSKQTGKDIPYQNLSENEYADILKSLGVPENYAYTIAGWDVGVSENQLFNESHVLSKLIGRPTTPLASSVKKVLG